MNQRSDTRKLHELRSKTDQQLLTLLQRRLNEAFDLARSYDEHSQSSAIVAHDEISRLLPLVYDLPAGERRRIESDLDELANLLNAAA